MAIAVPLADVPPAESSSAKRIAPSAMPAAPKLDERAWAEAYRRENSITKAAFAEQINYSRSAYARWEDGTYDGDPEPIAAAVRALRDRIEGPEGLSSVIGFRETATAKRVFAACEKALQGELVILIGESGEGKSEALREFVRRASRAGRAVPVYCEATVFTSAYALITMLGRALGMEQGRNPDALLRDIAAKLRRTPRILILDEAHYAAEKALEAVRQIRDQSGVGVVLAGTSVFAGVGYGQLGKSDVLHDLVEHRPHLEQVVSRATIWKIPGITPADVEAIATDVLGACTATGLERLEGRVGRSMRRLVRLIHETKTTRKLRRKTGPVDEQDVDIAWAMMYGGK